MKTRHALLIFILGLCIDLLGAVFKILHYPGGDQLLIVATSVKIIGGALILYKLLTHPKLKEFLDV